MIQKYIFKPVIYKLRFFLHFPPEFKPPAFLFIWICARKKSKNKKNLISFETCIGFISKPLRHTPAAPPISHLATGHTSPAPRGGIR